MSQLSGGEVGRQYTLITQSGSVFLIDRVWAARGPLLRAIEGDIVAGKLGARAHDEAEGPSA